MIKDFLYARKQDLAQKVQESLENHQRIKTALDNATNAHNALVGRLDETVYLYQKCEELDKKEPLKAK